jgi:hypothetical protein
MYVYARSRAQVRAHNILKQQQSASTEAWSGERAELMAQLDVVRTQLDAERYVQVCVTKLVCYRSGVDHLRQELHRSQAELVACRSALDELRADRDEIQRSHVHR